MIYFIGTYSVAFSFLILSLILRHKILFIYQNSGFYGNVDIINRRKL